MRQPSGDSQPGSATVAPIASSGTAVGIGNGLLVDVRLLTAIEFPTVSPNETYRVRSSFVTGETTEEVAGSATVCGAPNPLPVRSIRTRPPVDRLAAYSTL